MMSLSSSSLTGLRSRKVAFEVSGGSYEAQSYLCVNESKGEPADEPWTEEQVRRSIGAWWAGERTGDVATKVSCYRLNYVRLARANRRCCLPPRGSSS